MAENEDGQERSEEPTEKRKRESKEKGQVPRSRDLTTMLLLLGSAALLWIFGDFMLEGFEELFNWSFKLDRITLLDEKAPYIYLQKALKQGLMILSPVAIPLFFIALVSPGLLGGWTFSGEAMTPKPEKLSPLKGIKRMFGVKSLVELLKSIAKVLVVGAVSFFVFWIYKDDFFILSTEPLRVAIVHAGSMFFWAFFYISSALGIIAAIDVPFQLWQHNKEIKMTKQEIKDEYKETEGKPEVKGRIRQLQRQMAQARMMENVPEADVVVTNPTHFSVALKYDQLKMAAPIVVAKGTDLIAARIRELAQENEIPIFEAPPLARALYHTTEINDEVPAGLFVAVAQVLAYIFQLRGKNRYEQQSMAVPTIEIPEEFEQYTKQPEDAE
ncbi:MAG: flagellar biosynthesis protein FlhB [Gammaproteobacteria bacterium]|nr:MAG: flagellar biosynthesis protein FlhB [Gammaproteobacteria bacterium]